MKLDDSTVQLTLVQGPAARLPVAENPVHYPEGKGCVLVGGFPSQPLKGLEGLVGGVVGAGQHCVAELNRQLRELAVAKEHLVPFPARPQTQRRAQLRLGVGQDAAATTHRSSGEERQESRAQDGPVHFPSHSPSHSSTYVAHVHQLPGSNSPLHPIPPAPGPPSRQTKARSSALARMGSPARLLRLPAAAFDSSCTSRQAVKRREFEFKQSEFKTALNSDCLNSNSHL